MKKTGPISFKTGGDLCAIIVIGAMATLVPQEVHGKTSQACLQTGVRPIVEFHVKNAKTKLNRKKSSKQIGKIAKKVNAFQPTVKGRVLGLTFTEVGPQLKVEVSSERLAEGGLCVGLTRVEFHFGIRRAEIFVERKYKPGSCHFKAILAHEKEHMKINLKVQKKYEKKLRKELEKRVRNIRPQFSRSPQEAANRISKQLLADIKPIMKRFHKEKRKANMKIDTPKSYQQVRSQCANW